MSWFYNTTWWSGDKYQVIGPDGQFVIDKKEWHRLCRRWQLSGTLCTHAILILYYSKEKPENYIDAYYRVSTFMDIYMHILSPIHDRNSWSKSDQGPIIPPELVNKRRGMKTLLRRKKVGENIGLTNGKVNKEGVKMTCSMCGAIGHNKRYHGVKVNSFITTCGFKTVHTTLLLLWI